MVNISESDTIAKLKHKQNAAILAHYYQPAEIQEIADKVGDSFELAKFAKTIDNAVIVMCGVRFMAETVKILSPEKTVLLPVTEAGCKMADMITQKDVKDLRAAYPEAAVMCYVNTSAAVKAECDICCTSSSAVQAARALPQKQIIFIPDKNLGAYLKMKVPEKEFILWNGFCPVHDLLSENDIKTVKSKHPNAKVLVHAECREDVQKAADFCGSTSQIINGVKNSHNKEFIIGTESEVAKRLQTTETGKTVFLPGKNMICENMKKIKLEDVRKSLEYGHPEVALPDDILMRAQASLEKMMDVCR